MAAWSDLSGTVIRPEEVSILRDMDAAYRSALATEMQDISARRLSQNTKG